jgi:hypothetical protein
MLLTTLPLSWYLGKVLTIEMVVVHYSSDLLHILSSQSLLELNGSNMPQAALRPLLYVSID